MQAIALHPGGAYSAAGYFGVLPLVLLGAVWIARRVQGETGLWGASRFGYWPLAALLAAYYGVIWNWLFHDQFYGIEPMSHSEWRLQYRMPERIEALNPGEISAVRGENLASLTGGTTGRIVIELADGRRFVSAQVGRHRIPRYVEAIEKLAANAAQVE